MSAKPSRSEIESALSNSSKHSQTNKQTASTSFESTPASRRQQLILGGNLSGITKPKRFNINYINWVLSAIVLLILVAFFIPTQSNDSVTEVPNDPEKTVDIKPFYNQSRIDEQQINTSTKQPESFARNNDIDRADIYRDQEEQEAQITKLLGQAEDYIKQGAYTLPSNNNAHQSYLSILELDPKNRKAKQGIKYIRKRFLSAGLAALKKDKEANTVDLLNKLGSINRQSNEFNELNNALEQWRKDTRINELLAKARKAFAGKNLILPASESALHYYQQVLKVEPDHPNASKGIRQIADIFVNKANDAILAGQYEAATGYLTTVSVINPENDSISLIREMITNAKSISAERQANVEKDTAISAIESTLDQTDSINSTTVVETTDVETDTLNNTNTVNETLAKTSSSEKTPPKQSEEQQLFDRQYLTNGLTAYYKGEYETANALLQPLADKGISRAQFRIGYMYYLGRGLDKNRTEADRVIRAALPAVLKFAKEGRAWAQSDIGSLYEDGLVLPKDYSEAVYWYRRAAEQGYPGAQTNLGIMYAYGRGVSANRKTAIEWFQRAAEQGDIAAIRNLESLGIKI